MAIAQLQLDETNLMSRIASLCRLDGAFNWLCKNTQKAGLKDVYRMTKELGLKLAPAKTWLGKVSKGFNFLGYQISPKGINLESTVDSRFMIAQGSLSSMMTKIHRQNAQGATKKRLVEDVKRWITWTKAGVSLVDAPLKLHININPSRQRGYSFKLLKKEWSCCL